jgi:hypothetical protein
MNMTTLMVGILRVEERGNECASQAIDIDSRSKLQKDFRLAKDKDTPKCKRQ